MSMHEYPKTVTLKDARSVVLRLLQQDDLDKLHRFFLDLPAEDRIFFRHNVTDRNLIQRWTDRIDLNSVVPLVAEDGDKIVGDATLHMEKEGWMQHVGSIRVATASSHRSNRLGTFFLRELVSIAQAKNLEKIMANIIENDESSARLFRGAGFELLTVLKNMAKDRSGRLCNIAIMVNDVANLSRILEDWIQDGMIPAYRAPGEGVS